MSAPETPQQIIEAIVATGLNPSQIARHTGISQPTICRIQSGGHQDPRNSTVDALRALLKERLPVASQKTKTRKSA